MVETSHALTVCEEMIIDEREGGSLEYHDKQAARC